MRRGARAAKKRIAGRHAEARHFVDHRDFGMIEDRPGQNDAIGGYFRQHRGHDNERQQQRAAERQRAHAAEHRLALPDAAFCHRHESDQQRDDNDDSSARPRQADEKEQRQRQRAVHGPAERRREHERQRARRDAQGQWQAETRIDQKRGGGADQTVEQRSHAACLAHR